MQINKIENNKTQNNPSFGHIRKINIKGMEACQIKAINNIAEKLNEMTGDIVDIGIRQGLRAKTIKTSHYPYSKERVTVPCIWIDFYHRSETKLQKAFEKFAKKAHSHPTGDTTNLTHNGFVRALEKELTAATEQGKSKYMDMYGIKEIKAAEELDKTLQSLKK